MAGFPAAVIAAWLLFAQDPYAAERAKMVRDQIQSRGVKNAGVLKAMESTPRHVFMPENVQRFAYEDRPVPIGHGQTISQPYVVAYMTELLGVQKDHRVLEIGTGSGYQAAVLSPLAGEVYTIEIVEPLGRTAAADLKQLGYANVFTRIGDGYQGWPEKAPFDRVILTAAPPEIPDSLVKQLKPGGRLVAPVGAAGSDQEIIVLEKSKDGKVSTRSVLPVRFVPMVKGAATSR